MYRPIGLKTAAVVAAQAIMTWGCGGHEASQGEVADRLVVPERAGIYMEATQHYGPLSVSETPSEGIEAVADTKPWSGYWFPITDDVLVTGSGRNGGQCALDKYDQYSKKIFGKNSSSVAYEISSGEYVPSAEIGWEGRCNAWAIASVMEPEPILPPSGVELSGIKFFTRDVKALLIKSYELIDEKGILRFGWPFRGDAGEDRDDIYPDQFHRVLQAELFERHRPILMDSDAGIQIWNKPVWFAVTHVIRDSADSRVMHVTTRVKAVMSETIPIDYVGTWNKVFTYTYDLFGLPQANGNLLVKYGKWTGDSVKTHPDFVMGLPDKGVKISHGSKNKQLEQSVLDDVFAKTRAFSRP